MDEWIKYLPKKAGLYWFRVDGRSAPVVVEVVLTEGAKNETALLPVFSGAQTEQEHEWYNKGRGEWCPISTGER